MNLLPCTRLALPLALGLVWAGTAWAQAKPHEHGAVKLDLAIDGNTLAISMEAPLDNLLGFERAPRTAAERQAAAAVLARLRAPSQGSPLFSPDAAAQCSLAKAEVKAPVLEPAATPSAKGQAAAGDHADVDASYEFNCARPQQLRTLGLGLFAAYPRIQRIDVQVAGPQGQTKATLKRPASSVALQR